jgi:type III secretion protein C
MPPLGTGQCRRPRVFYLRYAWAQDVTMTVAGRPVFVPGVASILLAVRLASNSGNPLGREVLLRRRCLRRARG